MFNELYHHGILGMRWGKKNGPPYPLDAGDHSASERKAGWRKSLDKKDSSKSSGNHDTAKKVLTAVGTAAAVAGIAYVGYKAYQNANLSDVADIVNIGKQAMNHTDLAMDTPIAKLEIPKVEPKPFDVQRVEIPKIEINRTPIQRVEVHRTEIPTLTIDRSEPSGKDYTNQILSDLGKISAAATNSKYQVDSSVDVDSIVQDFLKKGWAVP